MKTYIRIIPLFLIILGLMGISSCEKRDTGAPGKGKAKFSISVPEQSLKSAFTDSTESSSYQLLVSVVDMNGNEVLSDELIPVYQFGDGFISEKVELETGKYKLTKFMMIDPSGKVIYAAPRRGSPLAYLVDKPLPIPFAIYNDRVTTITPEVLPVKENNPGDFGYVNFGLQIVRPLAFYVACYLDNPMIMAPTRYTEANLTVISETRWHYTFHLRARVNRLIIRGGSEIYYFILCKEGYETQKFKFSARQLEATTPENPLILKIPWGCCYKKLVLQPGPEKGKDAMISNLDPVKNFGDYKYFEATFLPEPQLTVMRSNRSLIWFDMNDLPKSAVIKKVILRLYYDEPIPWDSTVFISDSSKASDEVPWYGGVLQRIISPWDEHKVTWNDQPKTTTYNQVYISPFRCSDHYIDVDVTNFYLPVIGDSPEYPYYGMYFRLWPEDRFPGFRFASSDYPDATMRPRLTIFYTLDQ